MNALLKQALSEVEKLSEAEQESIAYRILEDIADRAWDERFAKSQDQLGELVRRAKVSVAENGALPYDPSDRPE